MECIWNSYKLSTQRVTSRPLSRHFSGFGSFFLHLRNSTFSEWHALAMCFDDAISTAEVGIGFPEASTELDILQLSLPAPPKWQKLLFGCRKKWEGFSSARKTVTFSFEACNLDLKPTSFGPSYFGLAHKKHLNSVNNSNGVVLPNWSSSWLQSTFLVTEIFMDLPQLWESQYSCFLYLIS